MRPIVKKLVTDEDHRPVAVLIDYEDWKAIEQELTEKSESPRFADLSRFKGVIKLSEDPVEYQRRIRDEWP